MINPETIPYFAYGPKLDPEIMKYITGRSALDGIPVFACGAELNTIGIEQIPDHNIDGSPSAKEELLDTFGPHYFGYALRKVRDSRLQVAGILHHLDRQAFERVLKWDGHIQGWLLRDTVQVTTGEFRSGLVTAETVVLPQDARVHGFAGVTHDPFLVRREKWLHVARQYAEDLAA